MVQDIYDPLRDYTAVYEKRFSDIAETTFENLAKEAHIDIDENHKLCKDIDLLTKQMEALKSRRRKWAIWRGCLWALFVIGIIVSIACYDTLSPLAITLICCVEILVPIYIFLRANKQQSKYDDKHKSLEEQCNKLKGQAWNLMSNLNRLYDWDIFARMVSKAVPKIQFDPYFTTQRLADLQKTYGWDGSFNYNRSILYSHSGLINGNPFVICRTRKMVMGTKAYNGYKTITWTTTETDSEGRTITVQHSQTLTATVVAPYPEYPEHTRLIYGNTAAPDLIFTRRSSGIAGREDSFSYKRTKRSLKRAERNLKNRDYAMMTNEEFEVAFDTRDRNNNQEYALLFTPLAQENIMNLLKDRSVGYGDDFDFYKTRMINTIIPEHMQSIDLDMNPSQFKHYNYERAKENFKRSNLSYFRSIYFAFAPLLCVPMYQQIRSREDIYGRDMACHSSFWEHEALANFWGQQNFANPSCVTKCILKTEEQYLGDGRSHIAVTAYGYRSEPRVSYKTVLGGDGNLHSVAVRWDEYIPVVGNGAINMKEDNDFTVDTSKQSNIINHINHVCTSNNLDLYRRHIASKIVR